MHQGPVIQSIHPARRVLPEKTGVRLAGHSDFDDVMNDRHQCPSLLPEQELQKDSDAPAETGEKRRVEDTSMIPVELPAAPPLELRLAVHHGVFLKWVESHDQGTAQAGDRHLPPRTGLRQQGKIDLEANTGRQNGQHGQAADAERELGNLRLRVPGQLAAPLHRQAIATPSLFRTAADPERGNSNDPVESLRLDPNTRVERPEHKLRVQSGRGTSGGHDAPHDQPGHQQGAPAISAAVNASKTPAAADAFTSPAEQISQRLSQVLVGMASDSKEPVTGTAIKSLNIILEPEQLGIVRVSLTLRAEGLHVRIAAGETTTADILRRDRHLLDGLLRPLGVDGLVAPVTISIEPLREAINTAPGSFAEQRAVSGSTDWDFHHSGPGHDRHPGADRQAGDNGSKSTAGKHEDVSTARSDRPGVMVV